MKKTYISFKYTASLLLLASVLFLVHVQSWLVTGKAGRIGYEDLNFRINNQDRMTITSEATVNIPSNSYGISSSGGIDPGGGDTGIAEARLLIDSPSHIWFNNLDVYSDPMIYMFCNGTENLDRMALANSFYHPDWGLSRSWNGNVSLSTSTRDQNPAIKPGQSLLIND